MDHEAHNHPEIPEYRIGKVVVGIILCRNRQIHSWKTPRFAPVPSDYYSILSVTCQAPNKVCLPVLAKFDPFSRKSNTSKVSGMKTPKQLSREAIDEFKAAYREEFDQTLSDDEVQEIAIRLLRFFGILIDSGPRKDGIK